MPAITRKELERHIDNGRTVLLPNGDMTRSKDDLPTNAELKKLHETAPNRRPAPFETSRALGDPTGGPISDDVESGDGLESDPNLPPAGSDAAARLNATDPRAPADPNAAPRGSRPKGPPPDPNEQGGGGSAAVGEGREPT